MNIPTYLSGAIFAKAHKALRETLVSSLKKYDLSPTAWTFLGVIVHSPDGIRLVEVAKRLDVKAPLVTLIAHRLIEQELIQRIPNQFDSRAKLLVITPKGRRLVAEAEAEVEVELSQLLRGLTADDLNTYRRVLETIITNSKS